MEVFRVILNYGINHWVGLLDKERAAPSGAGKKGEGRSGRRREGEMRDGERECVEKPCIILNKASLKMRQV